MHPEFWGPSGWKFLHYVTFQYPIKPTVNDKAIIKYSLILLNIHYLVKNVLIIIQLI